MSVIDSQSDFQTRFNELQQLIMLARRIQLGLGCLILSLIIISIISKKLYKYNTTKLFMWFCICYLIGMSIVLAHGDYITAGYRFAYLGKEREEDPNYLLKILNQMRDDGSLYLCGLQAFVNLYAYDFGYFFAVLVSYNVYSVINGNYRNFMPRVFKNPKVLVFLLFMLCVYLLPLILMLMVQDFTTDQFMYSYGPMGFDYSVEINGETRVANLLFFGGFVNFPGNTKYHALSLVNVFICPFLMVLIHSLILLFNRRKITLYSQQDYLNSRQQFLIKSGNLGLIVFIIQAIHFSKSLLGFLEWYTFLLIVNFVFDCYPFFLLYFFVRYTRERKMEQERLSSTISVSTQE